MLHFRGQLVPALHQPRARAANMVNVALTARSGGELVRQAATENGCRRWSASGHSGFSFRPAKTTIAKTTWSI